jgi:hypothetical protein
VRIEAFLGAFWRVGNIFLFSHLQATPGSGVACLASTAKLVVSGNPVFLRYGECLVCVIACMATILHETLLNRCVLGQGVAVTRQVCGFRHV